MSKVTQVTVRYGRSVQPKPYESKEALLEAVVVADEGKNVSKDEIGAVMRNFIRDVHVALGFEAAEAPVDNSIAEPVKETGKPRTRRTKKQIAEDKAAAEAEKPADEVPVEGDVSDNGGGRETASADVDQFKEPATETKVSDTDLQGAASRAAATHGAAAVKTLMKEFDVARLSELSQEQREAFLAKVDELGS